MNPELNPTTADHSAMYRAIEEDKLNDLKLLLKNGMDVNEPIITTGEFAGFTALHVACMKNKVHMMKLLVNDYKADVNAMAADGTQPIHLSCFYIPLDQRHCIHPEGKPFIVKIKILVEANANVNAEFGHEIFSKHVKYREWCSDFGDNMPLAAYAVIYYEPSIIYHLKNVNLDIISLKGKTLLMYAAENKCPTYISIIMSNVKDPQLRDKLINHRDNDDVPLTHYPLHPKKYGKFRYYETIECDNFFANSFFSEVSKWGADMYALINRDPATFLPNLAAYRSCPWLLKYLLPYYTSMPLSRVLNNATIPIGEESKQFVRLHFEPDRDFFRLQVWRRRKNCINIALKDLVFRSVLRLPVPEEEIKLMDELIASNETLRKIVDNFKRNFIENELQNCFIEFGDNKMTICDFLMQVYDDKKLKILVQEKNLLDSLDQVLSQFIDGYNFDSYYNPLLTKVKDAKERLRLLEKLKKIASLRKAIPLPFELVFYIVEYLNNRHLNVFINSFYSS